MSGFAGCAGVVEVTATADSQGVQLTERINYAQALAALSSLLAPQRRALGLPDFTLTPSDSPTALGLTK